MFQPKSIRSLLSRRQKSQNIINEQANSELPQKSIDPDYESLVQVRKMIHDVNSQVADIRNWRQHQAQLTAEKIKHNQQLARESVQQHMQYLEKEELREKEENDKIIYIMKKNIGQNDSKEEGQQRIRQSGKINQPQEVSQQTTEDRTNLGSKDYNLLAGITSGNQRLQEKKHQAVILDHSETFLNNINDMGDMFSRKETERAGKNVDPKLIRMELQQIDQQLKEIEQLMKD